MLVNTKQLFHLHSFSTGNIFQATQLKCKEYSKDVVIRNIDGKQQSPLVLIIGWANCRQKQIARYSELYEKQGCTTISVSSCQLYKFALFYDSLFVDDTKIVIDAMKSQLDVSCNRPIFLQLFSMIGPYIYLNILHYYYQVGKDQFQLAKLQKSKEEIIPNIRGVVYDSPAIEPTTVTMLSDALNVGVTNTTLLSMIERFSDVVFPYIIHNHGMHGVCSKLLKRAPILLPQLYLYSNVDHIAPYKDIDEFIKYQKSVGADVKSKMWDDSDHVAHFRKYPKEYENLVISFINECMLTNDKINY